MKTFLTTRHLAMTAACSACLALVLAVSGCNDTGPTTGADTTSGSAQMARPSLAELGLEDAPTPTMTLYQAVSANNLEQVRANIAAGADLNELVPDGDRGRFSALHGASRAGYIDILRLLIAAGADVDIRADAAHRATPLHWAARAEQLEAVQVLVEAGADVNARAGVDGNLTPMRTAVDRNLHEIVQYLANNGGQM